MKYVHHIVKTCRVIKADLSLKILQVVEASLPWSKSLSSKGKKMLIEPRRCPWCNRYRRRKWTR